MNSCFKVLALALIISFFTPFLRAQNPPKRELRSAWIATVSNLDWPTRGADPSTQRAELTLLLDALKLVGINSVVFQIRTECDALYPSNIEPWSYWLTGQQGKAPVIPFDPLQFALDEAHKRGMELHAWFNPYRVEVKAGSYTLAANHVSVLHPDWVIQMGTYRFLNPGMQLVRDYTASVIADVVRRYDIDGAHMDDYFYQDGITNQDSFTFQSESRGFADLGNWRRDNVNSLIKQVYDSIKAIKPNVKWGISPRGIWRPGYPPGITGSDNYNAIYCDATAWLQGQYIDYITPQLYWPFGGNQDYGKLMPWWSSVKNGRHLYVGQGSYRIVASQGDWGPSELPNQIRLNRTNSYAQGSVYFRAKSGLTDNPKGLADSLKKDLYRYPALRPLMSWKEAIPPNAPTGLTISKFSSFATLSWEAPLPASDGGVADQYVLYRSTSLPIQIDDARNIVLIQGARSYVEQPLPPSGVTYYYGVTAVDRLQNESTLSNVMGLNASGVVAVGQTESVPKEFALMQNYPNPFSAGGGSAFGGNPYTAIRYYLPASNAPGPAESLAKAGNSSGSWVSLRVFDVLGRHVATLVSGLRSAGGHTVNWDGINDRGERMSSGVYFYQLTVGSSQITKKMILTR
jgi:uncharacterized lipoprotein YddW (UPF0748 family)